LFRHALASSRYVVIIAVVSTFVSSMALLIHGALLEATVVIRALREGAVSSKGVKALALGLIEATDIFLIGIVFLVVSLGLYALFVDATHPLPARLQMRDLDDLKGQIVGVVITVLAVLFLGEMVRFEGQSELLGIGVAIAVVVAALTFFLNIKKATKD
jgi:uncharacterized membrane protein YqhA